MAFMPLCFNAVSSQRIKHLEEKAGMAKNKAEAEAGMAKNKNKAMENEKAASRRGAFSFFQCAAPINNRPLKAILSYAK